MVERLYYNKYKMLDYSKEKIESLGFKKIISEPDLYYYRFVVDKYKNIPTLWCKLILDSVTGEVVIDVLNTNGSFCSAFYQYASGFDDYIEKVNNKIKYKLNKLGIKKVVKKKRKKKEKTNGDN